MDYWSGLSAIVAIKYSSSSGEPFVHLPQEPAYPPIYPNVWAFKWINNWRDQFDKVLFRFLILKSVLYLSIVFQIINSQLGNSLVTWSRLNWEMEEHYLVENEGRVWYNEWYFLFWTTKDWHPHPGGHAVSILPIHPDNPAINNCCHYWMSGPKDKKESNAKHRQNDEGRATRPTTHEAKIDRDFGHSFTIKCVGVGESRHVTYMMPCGCSNANFIRIIFWPVDIPGWYSCKWKLSTTPCT